MCATLWSYPVIEVSAETSDGGVGGAETETPSTRLQDVDKTLLL